VAELPDVDETVQRIEALVQANPESGELAQLLMRLYGEGLSRSLEIIRESGGPLILERLAEDKLVASLLLLHGLHPVDAGTRLRNALRRLKGVSVDIQDGKALIRVQHNGGGAPSASLTATIEQLAMDAAPDLDQIEIEGAPSPVALVQIAPAGTG
jgi:hypothetical protein